MPSTDHDGLECWFGAGGDGMVRAGVPLEKGRSGELGRARIRVLSTGDNPVCHITPGHRSGPRCRDKDADVVMSLGHLNCDYFSLYRPIII